MTSRDVVFYDGLCRFCTQSAERLRAWLPPASVDWRSFRDPGALEGYPELNLERCERALQLVRASDRAVFEGAEAVVQLLRHRWFGAPLKAYYLPLVRPLADAAYRAVAARRFRIAGATAGACGPDGTCHLHVSEERRAPPGTPGPR